MAIESGTARSSSERSRALTVVLAALVFALGLSRPGDAAVIECASGDVACLIAAINTANANGQANTIRLQPGTYTLRAVDNDTDGANGLPSITGPLTLVGEGILACLPADQLGRRRSAKGCDIGAVEARP